MKTKENENREVNLWNFVFSKKDIKDFIRRIKKPNFVQFKISKIGHLEKLIHKIL